MSSKKRTQQDAAAEAIVHDGTSDTEEAEAPQGRGQRSKKVRVVFGEDPSTPEPSTADSKLPALQHTASDLTPAQDQAAFDLGSYMVKGMTALMADCHSRNSWSQRSRALLVPPPPLDDNNYHLFSTADHQLVLLYGARPTPDTQHLVLFHHARDMRRYF